MAKYKVTLRDDTTVEIEAHGIVNNSYYEKTAAGTIYLFKNEILPVEEDEDFDYDAAVNAAPVDEVYIGDLDLEDDFMKPPVTAAQGRRPQPRYPQQVIIAVFAGDQWKSIVRTE